MLIKNANIIFSRISIIFFIDARNGILSVFFGEDNLCYFKILCLRRKKRCHLYQIYRKHHISMYFLRKIIFHFPPRKNIIFSRKISAIFPDDTRKIIFWCYFLGKIIFLEHSKKTSYFHVFFWERSSFIFRLKNKIILSGKINIIFPADTRNIILQCKFSGKIIFSEDLEKENMVFCAVYVVCKSKFFPFFSVLLNCLI